MIKARFSLLCLILFFLSITKPLVAAHHTAYYSTLAFVETPLPIFKGSIPLTEKEAMTRNHYRFEFDELNRIASISFYNGYTRKAPNHTANLFYQASQIKFEYQKNKEILTFFDRFGNQQEVFGATARFVYQLDEQGFRTMLYFEDLKGERLENSWNIYKYTWNLRPDGSVIEERFNQQGELVSIRPHFHFYRIKLSYNHLGNIALMQNIDKDGNLVENDSGAAQDQITTNAAGHFLEWTVLDKTGNKERGNGPDVAKGIQTTNQYGYETSLRHEDEVGNTISNTYGFAWGQTSFDQWGNLSARTFFDKKENPTPHEKAGYVSLKMFWDKTGNNRLGIKYYDINGQLTEHQQRGYAQAKQSYDDSGNMIKIAYYDKKGDLVNRIDRGYAYLIQEFDAQNQKVKSTAYDKDGKQH